ncbi:MAG: hypothetical protein Q7T32_05350 [Moraxellaceae bacterium]|nr:hypothetical protein [Moraxellaceae bacterium]
MNGPDDIRDEELSRRYRALPPELPHADTDAAIQAAARQAIAPGKHKPRVMMFYSGLAMAASVILVVALMLPSWRSGELQEHVAVDVASAPAELPPVAPADTAPVEQAVAVAGSPASPTLHKKADVQAVQQAQGAQPAAPLQEMAAADTSEQDAELAGAMPTVAAVPPAAMPVPAAAPALVDKPMEAERREAVAKEAMADSLKARMADRTRAKNVASQQARAAAIEAATVSAVPTVAPATDSLDVLLLAGRHADALTLLQTGDSAADPALDSRRDLLRQLLAGADKALQCRPEAGPASAQALCRLLQRYQASHVVPADQLVLLRQALQAEGQDARPWLQAVARLP